MIDQRAKAIQNTPVRQGQEFCKRSDSFKAWSQCFEHEKVLTTFLAMTRSRASRSPTPLSNGKHAGRRAVPAAQIPPLARCSCQLRGAERQKPLCQNHFRVSD